MDTSKISRNEAMYKLIACLNGFDHLLLEDSDRQYSISQIVEYLKDGFSGQTELIETNQKMLRLSLTRVIKSALIREGCNFDFREPEFTTLATMVADYVMARATVGIEV